MSWMKWEVEETKHGKPTGSVAVAPPMPPMIPPMSAPMEPPMMQQHAPAQTRPDFMRAAGGYRVTGPPGGPSQVNLGWQEPEKAAPRGGYAPENHKCFYNGGSTSGVSSNAFANGASQNTGNSLTDRPTTRVVRPPGGHSTITLG